MPEVPGQYSPPHFYPPPPPQVCFIKVSERPSANVTFHSCNDSFAVDLSSIKPPPIFARYPDIQMFSTVFHVSGVTSDTSDARWLTGSIHQCATCMH